MNRFIASTPDRCIGCRTCEVACALAHQHGMEGVAALSPADFLPRLRVVKSRDVSTPVGCRHCEDAPCANACPNGAIVCRDDSVQVLQERCIGCKSCVMACPFGAIDVVTVPATRQFAGLMLGTGTKALAHKCDLCGDRAGGPACVSVCPTKALGVMTRQALDQTLRQRRERAAVEVSGQVLAL